MIPFVGKLDLDHPLREQFNRGEQGDTLILGGCDEQGNEVCNDLAFLFLRAHRELKLIYPKIHCRYSAGSSPEFLDAANLDFLNGRNTVSFLNDDVLIPAQVKAGKALADARGYVAGGCWEVMVEGCEHAQGANCYFNPAPFFSACPKDCMESRRDDSAGGARSVPPPGRRKSMSASTRPAMIRGRASKRCCRSLTCSYTT